MSRPTRAEAHGAGLGAALGAVFAGPPGAALLGLLGAGVGAAVPLPEALETAGREKGVDVLSVRRPTRYQVALAIRDRHGRYGSLTAKTPKRAGDTPKRVDDRLYDSAVRELSRLTAHASR